jgi:hypothetical protein
MIEKGHLIFPVKEAILPCMPLGFKWTLLSVKVFSDLSIMRDHLKGLKV